MRISKKKVLLVLGVVFVGSVLPASAGRRNNSTTPPPTAGTLDKPVFSPV